jgi:phosphatidylglycerol:prolipoprotein diacylglycerol transferase
MRSRPLEWNVDPVLLRLGPVELRWYGVLLALAVLVALLAWYRRATRHGETSAFAEGWIWRSALAAFVGGRVGEVLFYDPRRLVADPLTVLRVWEGGLASHGAAFGVAVATLWYVRGDRDRWLRVADLAAPGAVLGTCLVRLGNFVNGELVGRPTDVPWAVVFARHDVRPRHPVQLYEVVAGLAAVALMWLVERRGRRRVGSGLTTAVGLLAYFGLRVLVEPFKPPPATSRTLLAPLADATGLALTPAQWLSLVPLTLGVVLLVRALRRPASRAAVGAR